MCLFCMHSDTLCSQGGLSYSFHITLRLNIVFISLFFFNLSAPSSSASFMEKIIESMKRNASPEKQRNNSLPTV